MVEVLRLVLLLLDPVEHSTRIPGVLGACFIEGLVAVSPKQSKETSGW